MTPVKLREYDTREGVELSPESARRLQDAAGKTLRVTPGARSGTYDVTATQWVGSIVLPDVQVLIRPKIEPKNLFLLLEAGIPAHQWRREAFDYAVDQSLLSSVVSFFARTAESCLARGVHRSYRSTNDQLVALRGRIDMRAQFRRPGMITPIDCTFDEYSVDNLENRYLRAAIQRARRVAAVPRDTQHILARSLARLEDVADAPVQADDFDRIVFNRLNEYYEPSLRLARLILRNLTLLDASGKTGASTFLVDMNALFQRFVTERLRRQLRAQLKVVNEPTRYLGQNRKVVMYPDLEFHDAVSNKVVYVGDIKYKLTKDGRARASDYYQLLAYCTTLGLTEGVLVYCLDDGSPPESVVKVVHSGARLHTVPIDLTGNEAQVEAAISKLATWIVSHAQIGAAQIA